MARVRGMVAAAAVSSALGLPGSAIAAPTPVPETLDLLGEALDALQAGHVEAYDEVAHELRHDGHWLPDLGWDAVDELDESRLELLWLVLDATEHELIEHALLNIEIERAFVADLADLGDVIVEPDPFDDGPLSLSELLGEVDDDGVMILDVALHRRIHLSEPAQIVLGPLTVDPTLTTPDLGRYDDVLVGMAARLEGLPPIAAGRPPVPTMQAPGAPGGTGTAATGARTGVLDDPTARSDGSAADPTTIALGVVAALGLVLAIVAMRRNRHNDRLADIAFTDSLTGLSNRRRLDCDLDHEARHGDRQTAVLMIDVDHFKQLNDTHGHVVGDDVLRQVAVLIDRNVRERDLTYRYGGEEFSVLLPDAAPDEANDVGERVRRAIEGARITLADGSVVSVTASLGLSSGPAETVGHLVQRADHALYRAKDNGRNQLALG